MKMGPTEFILTWLQLQHNQSSAQICDAYSDHLGHRCNHANMTTRLKQLSESGRILRSGTPGHYYYNGVSQ